MFGQFLTIPDSSATKRRVAGGATVWNKGVFVTRWMETLAAVAFLAVE